ncbi:LPS export ABC transporter periplasmic protein LptC [Parvularcula sp. IMCC14364]|uniref:LPS export ABC transporter periplasmic protein LptC n=1 Tax=Parvularcula sp. IMCC14364 TaxID=3067902 RepID=UPI00274119DB|nr:LPS export ABC transporter periplasmic protein LptC [Parvularcula sp. IMCC14364]
MATQTSLTDAKRKKRVRQHSRFVRATRLSLPVVIAGIVAAYVVTATPHTVDHTFVDQFQNLDAATDDLRMEQPRFINEDKQGRPYEVKAGAAVQNPAIPDFISLENPEALKALGEIDQSLVTARTGLYSLGNKTIKLDSEVEFKQGLGDQEIVLNMDAAEVRLEDRTVHSDVNVYGENQNGSISAEGMTAFEEEGRTVFYNARMVIAPKGETKKLRSGEPEETAETGEDVTPDT